MSVMGQYIIADNQDITRARLISILKRDERTGIYYRGGNYNELLLCGICLVP